MEQNITAKLRGLWRRLWRRRSEPQDPYARVFAPKSRRPGGRSSAVALEEPMEPRLVKVKAIGRWCPPKANHLSD